MARRTMTRIGVPVVVGLAVWGFAMSAAAEVTVCNKFSDVVWVAIGYQEAGDFKTAGWWTVASGRCTVVDSRAVTMPYYIHAETPKRNGMRHFWGKGGKRLAVDSKKFNYVRADQIAPGDRTELFTQVYEGGTATSITYTILNATSSMTQKR